jgi:RecA-family ATPase
MPEVSPHPSRLRVRAASQLEPRPVAWLWPGWLPEGKLALLDGDPGVGKSMLTLDLCARLSTGRPMPDGNNGSGRVPSLVLNAEDGAEDTIKNRLDAFGADKDLVFVVDQPENDWVSPVRLPSQWEALDQAVACHGAKLVVIDPIVAFLDASIQANSDQSVRRALGPLHQIAARHGCSFLLVRHLNKESHGRARYRGGGSIGFQGACRTTWLVERDPATADGLVLAQVKNNLAARQPSLSFAVAPGVKDEALAQAWTLDWRGPSTFSADQLLAAAQGKRNATEIDRACRFLEKQLENGPLSTRVIWEASESQGLSERELREAKRRLMIRSKRVGSGTEHRAYWALKHQDPLDGLMAQTGEEPEPDLSPWLDPLIAAYPAPTPIDEE